MMNKNIIISAVQSVENNKKEIVKLQEKNVKHIKEIIVFCMQEQLFNCLTVNIKKLKNYLDNLR